MKTTSNKTALTGFPAKKLSFVSVLCFLFFNSVAQWSSEPQFLQSINAPAGYTNSELRYRNDVAVDNFNNTYIAFQNIGIGKYNGGSWTMYNVANGSLLSDTVTSVTTDSLGGVLATTANGVSIFGGSLWVHYNSSNSPLPLSGAITAELNSGKMWVGTNNGVFSFDGVTWTSFNTGNSGLGNDSITAFAFNGTHIYAGTKNGLYDYNGSSWNALTNANASVPSVADIEVNQGELWTALTNGSIYYYDGTMTPHQLTFPASTTGCTSFLPINSICLKSDNGYIYFFAPDPNNALSAISRSDTTHTVYTHLRYLLTASSGQLFDIKNGFIATSPKLQPVTMNQISFYRDDISGLPLTAMDADFLEYSNLNINKVDTRINILGDMHWDPVAQIPIYQVPACEGKTSIYSSGFWMGGYDNSNQLHLSAATYRQMGAQDYVAGPLDTITAATDSITAARYDRVWKVNRSAIDDFIYNFQQGNVTNGTYPVPEVIASWPAHGGGSFSNSLAPFVDVNLDGIYNPMDGDYPSIDGDQELWFIFNDQRLHTESQCASLGVEVHGKAYAYNCTASDPSNDVINYTTFYQYEIINRSGEVYHDSYVGLMVDPDLGNASDDYVGCNVPLNTGFVYNADIDDDGVGGYGLKPPYQNVTILRGPLADTNDGIDNDKDGAVDEPGECDMMSKFLYYINWNNQPNGNPAVCDDYMQYLNGTWLDGLPVTYGEDGRNQNNPPCNYMFPGLTDPNFSLPWTMSIAGMPGNDMRFIISCGTFTLMPGESRTFDFAYIYTRDTVGNWPTDAEANNVTQVSKVIQWFNNGLSSCPVTAIHENSNAAQILDVHPNPADRELYISGADLSKKQQYTVTDITGRVCLEGKLIKSVIDISALHSGAYQIALDGADGRSIAKFIRK
jgi:hypothetical protein